jgi:hypothetical protein
MGGREMRGQIRARSEVMMIFHFLGARIVELNNGRKGKKEE